jgi:hypothetical protein
VKIEANLPAARAVATSAAASCDANGWLAALEQGCIDQLRQDDAGSPPATNIERPAASPGAPEAGVGAASAQAPSARAPETAAAGASFVPVAAPTPAVRGPAAVPAAGVVATRTADAPGGDPGIDLDAPPAAPAPLARAADDAHPPAELRSSPPAAAPEVAHSPAPEYARQRMQLTPGDVPQVALRDAALPDASVEGVARAIAAQLREDGQPAVRVFVNGRRFDFAGPASDAPEARRPADHRHDQEA